MYYINVIPFNISWENENIHTSYLSLVNNPEYADVWFHVTSEIPKSKLKQYGNYDKLSPYQSLIEKEKKHKIYAHSSLLAFRLMNEKAPKFIQDVITERKNQNYVIKEVPKFMSISSLLRILEFLYWGTFVNKIDMVELTELIKVLEILEFTIMIKFLDSFFKNYDPMSK